MNELNSKIEQTLHDFDALQDIQPSDAWQQSLMDKLAATTSDAPFSFSTRVLTVVVLLFVALNIGFILKETATETSAKFVISTTLEDQRATDFKTISKELFINPASITH
jgi:hypothetical protein